jgi:tRNA (mo5U34)-methyltransferase
MKLYQRACHVLARDGFSGLARRAARKLFTRNAGASEARRWRQEIAAARAAYPRLVEEFNARAGALGLGDVRHYYWYHTVDLGDGLVTPGDYDYRHVLDAFRFPDDMTGMDVLDVGAATGFFSFEFERRGARVVAVDLPSLNDWDIIHGEREGSLKGLMEYHRAATHEETHHRHLEGPFEFCRQVLGSKVRRVHSTVYGLSRAALGVDGFDLIYLGDVLPHIFSPLAALDALAPLCKGTLVISSDLWEDDALPAMRYTGGDGPCGDHRSWWRPNRLCLEQMLRTVGFREVRLVGRHRSVLRRHWAPVDRPVLHAVK